MLEYIGFHGLQEDTAIPGPVTSKTFSLCMMYFEYSIIFFQTTSTFITMKEQQNVWLHFET
jgi:hypothetical protein